MIDFIQRIARQIKTQPKPRRGTQSLGRQVETVECRLLKTPMDLAIVGTDQDDIIEVSYRNSTETEIEVSRKNSLGEEIGNHVYDAAEIGRITIYGYAGDDFIRNDTNIEDVLYGGAGSDHIHAGHNTSKMYGDDGVDYLYGRGGHDTIYGGGMTDLLEGGNGNDTLYGEGGDDYLYDDLGNDKLFGAMATTGCRGDATTMNSSGETAMTSCMDGQATT